MTDDEILEHAWRIVWEGAEGYCEDWIDEGGEYSEEDGETIFRVMGDMIYKMRQMPPVEVEIERD
jgi:hypothetical protein